MPGAPAAARPCSRPARKAPRGSSPAPARRGAVVSETAPGHGPFPDPDALHPAHRHPRAAPLARAPVALGRFQAAYVPPLPRP
eukprot:15456392-Alexandrium_andersonii.AAC.2